MPATGELIRSMNYVEDITTTLRRICISIPAMSSEERQRLAESLRAAGAALTFDDMRQLPDLIAQIEASAALI